MTKVSIIFPIHKWNDATYETIESIKTQSLSEFDVFCIYYGKSEMTFDRMTAHIEKDQRINVMQIPCEYECEAIRYGTEKATGKYIVAAKTGVRYSKDFLKNMYGICEAHLAEVAICGAKSYYQSVDYYRYPKEYLDVFYMPEKECFSAKENALHLFDFTDMSLRNKMINREYLLKKNILSVSTHRSDELLFMARVFYNADRIAVLKECQVTYLEEMPDDRNAECECQNAADIEHACQGVMNEKYACQGDFCEVLKALQEELISRKLEALYRRTFCNRVMMECLSRIEEIRSEEHYLSMHKKIQNTLKELRVVYHGQGYFYHKDKFVKMLDLLDSSGEEAWKKHQMDIENRSEFGTVKSYENIVTIDGVSTGKQPKISVILPIYNVGLYLEQCLDSLINQTMRDIEIICVNDGSTDNSKEIAEKYSRLDPRIKLINQTNQGLSVARNTGLKYAAGEYIHFMDSDDYIDEKTYEIAYYEAKQNELDILYFGADSIYDPETMRYRKGVSFRQLMRLRKYDGIMTGKALFTKLILNNAYHVPVWLYIVKKTHLDQFSFQFVPGLVLEDALFTTICLTNANRVKHINLRLYHYRIRENSIITSMHNYRRAKSFMIVLKELSSAYLEYGYYKDAPFSDAYLDFCAKIYQKAWQSFHKINDESLSTEFAEFIKSLDIKMYPVLVKMAYGEQLLIESRNNRMKVHQIKDMERQLKMLKKKSDSANDNILNDKRLNNKKSILKKILKALR